MAAVYEARVEETPAGALVVVIDGYRFEIEVRDPRRLAPPLRRGGERRAFRPSVAPMPGKVVRVLVAPRATTSKPGQGLLVVEAMKMQNEMKAPRAGKVLSMPAQRRRHCGRGRSAGDHRVKAVVLCLMAPGATYAGEDTGMAG